MDTQSIRLRNVPCDIARKAKIEAINRGQSLEQYVLELLTKALYKEGQKK